MAFYVGQKVVCVKRGPWAFINSNFKVECAAPSFGEVYTIIGIQSFGHHGTFLSFLELEPPFWLSTQFRPLVEKKSGMDVIEHIRLGGKPEGFEEPKREKVAS